MGSSDAGPGGLLEGVRVLSLGAFVAGNVCPVLLADLGADVVKVETVDRPEALRAYDAPDQSRLTEPSGVRTTALFAGLTRGLRSVSLDMNIDAGRDTFRSLAAGADVVIENLGPETVGRWGCSFADLNAVNPRLVMLSMSGYGRTGPMAGYRAYASSIGNNLGVTSAWVPDGTHFDFIAGVHGASAIVAGLAAVAGGAPGVLIDLAQTEAGAATMASLYLDCLAGAEDWHGEPNQVPGSLLSCVVAARGVDAWVAVELEDTNDWNLLCSLLGVALVEAPALRDALAAWAIERTPWQAALELQRAGVAAAPVQNTEDVWRDPQLRGDGAFVAIDHPDVGVVEYPNTPSRRLIGTPGRGTRAPGRVAGRGPRLGEHTRVVLGDWVGLSNAAIDDLARAGAIWEPDD